jgi:hypothetical protein
MHSHGLFETQRTKNEDEERQRDEREQIKRDQDRAYQAYSIFFFCIFAFLKNLTYFASPGA